MLPCFYVALFLRCLPLCYLVSVSWFIRYLFSILPFSHVTLFLLYIFPYLFLPVISCFYITFFCYVISMLPYFCVFLCYLVSTLHFSILPFHLYFYITLFICFFPLHYLFLSPALYVTLFLCCMVPTLPFYYVSWLLYDLVIVTCFYVTLFLLAGFSVTFFLCYMFLFELVSLLLCNPHFDLQNKQGGQPTYKGRILDLKSGLLNGEWKCQAVISGKRFLISSPQTLQRRCE